MSLASRIVKLEAKQKQVLRCPWCRFALREAPPTLTSLNRPRDVMPTKCWHCGTQYVVPLGGLNEHQREVLALIYNSHPTRQFTDERVHAALIWFGLYRSEVKQYEREMRDQGLTESRSSHRVFRPAHAPNSLRNKKFWREREDLEQRALDFSQEQLKRFKALAAGPESFPIDKTFEEIEKALPTSAYDHGIDELLQDVSFEKYSQSSSHLRSALATCNRHLQPQEARGV